MITIWLKLSPRGTLLRDSTGAKIREPGRLAAVAGRQSSPPLVLMALFRLAPEMAAALLSSSSVLLREVM